MIQLFLADIDGCLSEPYRPYDLDAFRTLRAWGARAEAERAGGRPSMWPRLSLLSGRAYAYVEAVTQALGLAAPVLFESGGGRFHLPTATITWNPALTPQTERDLDAVRAHFLEGLVAGGRFGLDYGKRAQAGVVCVDTAEVARSLPAVREFVTARFPELRVYDTPVSIDVVPAALTKAQAVAWLAASEGLALDEVAFIGDTSGDVEALQAVGLGFAPQNASAAARAAADVVTAGAVAEGVLEAYHACVARNGGEVPTGR